MDLTKPLSLLESAFPLVFFTESFENPRDFANARIEFYKNALSAPGKPGTGESKPTVDALLREIFASEEQLKAFYACLLKNGRVEDNEIRLKSNFSILNKARMSSNITRLRTGVYCLQGYFSQTTQHLPPESVSAPPANRECAPQDTGGVLGNSKAIEKVAAAIDKIGPLNTPVLLEGEPGTGKKHIARAIHQKSARAMRPFIAVHCGALSETLMDSELFGHTQGSFSGAECESAGLLEKAEGGSIYLDEIDALPLGIQFKLLRFLQEGEIRRLGSTRSLKADVRLVAGCHGNLEKQVAAKTFNEDLYRRIQLFALKVPPLRERDEDILLLADHFLKQSLPVGNPEIPQISRSAALTLKGHKWPGNVRELKSVVERAALLCVNGLLSENHLCIASPSKFSTFDAASASAASLRPPQDEVIRQKILGCLEKNRWNKTRTAQDLNISRATLWRKIKEFSIAAS